MPGFAGRKRLGIDFDKASSATREHELGLRAEDEAGNVYQYIQANGAITANAPVKIDGSFDCAVAGNVGLAFAVAHVAISDNEYGWVTVHGVVTADVATSTADNAVLARLCDSNGDLVTMAVPNEAGTATHAAGSLDVFAVALAAESGGTASVFIL